MDDRCESRARVANAAEAVRGAGGQTEQSAQACGHAKKRGLPAEEELVAAARAAHERRAGPMTLEVFERLTPFKTWQVSRDGVRGQRGETATMCGIR